MSLHPVGCVPDAGHDLGRPLTITGRDGRSRVRFPCRVMLAPMEGVTDRVFRSLVIALGGVGGACTEFLRISSSPVPAWVVARELGTASVGEVPVGVQFMAGSQTHVAASIAGAEAAGAPWIDLNFGCPVPVVFNKCAGSALLAHPERIGRIVATAVAATTLPVSAKIRAGIADAHRLDDIVAAIVEAGAAMLTVHARLRSQSYAQPPSWEWIAQARRAIARSGRTIPLVGNGGVEAVTDAAAMMAQTGCDAVMIGRGALADPWLFRSVAGGAPALPAEAVDFALGYASAVEAAQSRRAALGKLKQLVRWYRAGGIFAGAEPARLALLRATSLEDLRSGLLARLADAGAGAEAVGVAGSLRDLEAQTREDARHSDERQPGDCAVIG